MIYYHYYSIVHRTIVAPPLSIWQIYLLFQLQLLPLFIYSSGDQGVVWSEITIYLSYLTYWYEC